MTRANTPAGFTPPYEAFEARYEEEGKPLVTAFIGLQDRGGDRERAWTAMAALMDGPHGPDSMEQGYHDDTPGARSWLRLAYWRDSDRFECWRSLPQVQAWLEDEEDPLLGRWLESASVRPRALDTLIADPDRVWGLGKLADRIDVTPYHGYWGGTRDRILLSVEDGLENPDGPSLSERGLDPEGLGQIVDLVLPANTVCARGGPDWSRCLPDERTDFLNTVYPAYVAGGRYLREHGEEAGCYGAYLVQETDADGNDVPRNHMVAFFVQLSNLEEWTSAHPTHTRIFGRFMLMLKRLGRMPDVNLYHEVSVMPPGGLRATYVNCLPETGMLRHGLVRSERTPS